MPTALDEEAVLGDITTTDENPVIHAASVAPVDPLPHVLSNHTLAREPEGSRCIAWGKYRLSAAEAHKLAIELTDAADAVSEIRVKQGFES